MQNFQMKFTDHSNKEYDGKMPSAIYYVQQLPESQFQVTMEVKFI